MVGEQIPVFAPVTPAGPAGSGVVGDRAAAAGAPPRASLRGVSFQLLLASGADLAAAYATGNETAMQMATLRATLTVVTFLGGLVAGRRRGLVAGIAALSALVLALVQGYSLYGFGTQLLADPGVLQAILPNAATQGLSFLAALRVALRANR